MTRIGDKWPPVMLADLKRGFDEGLEARQIAERLNAAYGTQLSKSAVIGRLNRLGLFRKERAPQRLQAKLAAHNKRRKASEKKMVAVERPAPAPEPVAPLPVFRFATVPVPMIMLSRSRCKWPVNDGGPFLFCGLPRSEHHANYCQFHAALSTGRRGNEAA